MSHQKESTHSATLSVVIPCFNEENTLAACIDRVREIADDQFRIEIIIVDDASTDRSLEIARKLESDYNNVLVIAHDTNQGKGAALRSGFQKATGEYVAVQDADLEYNPSDLRKLCKPLIDGDADVVFGSRFLSGGAHRVLYFWHSLGNKFLTFLSNMFTDLNLTDMETCYKLYRRKVIQSITIEEDRFGVEPEVVAKVAQMRLRVYEMGVSYRGRTYEEGKKIGIRDGFRALYCIFRYNLHQVPLPVQLLIFMFIGGLSGLVNIGSFLGLSRFLELETAAYSSYTFAAAINFVLCASLLFQHKPRWRLLFESTVYIVLLIAGAIVDAWLLEAMIRDNIISLGWAKAFSVTLVFLVVFILRRIIVPRGSKPGLWRPQSID